MRFIRNFIPAFAIALSSCVETTAVANADVVGRWDLSTVNGQALPFAVEVSENQVVEITADDIEFLSNGTLTGSTSLRLLQDGQTIDTDTFQQSGTWSRNGNTISLTFTENGQSFDTTATLGDGTLTINGGGDVYLYRR